MFFLLSLLTRSLNNENEKHFLAIFKSLANEKQKKIEKFLWLDSPSLILSRFVFFADIEPQFPYRQVSIKRGEDVKESYELSEEIGR